MSSKWRFVLRHMTRRLWLHAAFFALLAIIAALFAAVFDPHLPISPGLANGARSVENILAIIASSMLAVATFALSTLISAFSTVQATASPRAAALLIEDRSAQTALSGFMGAFIFSVVGLVALATGLYGEGGRAILFMETVVVLGLVVISMVQWINEASHLGLMSETLARVERATLGALAVMQKRPYLGAGPPVQPPSGCAPLTSTRIGYIQHIDVRRLEARAARLDLHIHLQMTPGDFADGVKPLALIDCRAAALDEAVLYQLRGAFVIDETRTFDQDPGYGLIMLREIGCRALSPAINDAGTAIAVIGSAVRVLRAWAGPEQQVAGGARVRAASVSPAELFDDVFTPMARDGARLVEVGLRLQAAFQSVAAIPAEGFREAAKVQALLALDRARSAMDNDADLARLERAARPLLGAAADRPISAAQERAVAESLP